MDASYRVVVVEDEELILDNIVSKIEAANLGFRVVGKAANGRRALEMIEHVQPDVVFTDIRMPLMDGLELSEELRSGHMGLHLVIISGFSDFQYAQQALRHQVSDYLLKPVQEEDLRHTLLRLKANLDRERESSAQAAGISGSEMSLEEALAYLRSYIRENYQSDIDFRDLLAGHHYTTDYIHRQFVRTYGETPAQYQLHLRMNRAKRLLRTDRRLSVRQVAEAVGYTDQSYFSRMFKKHAGCSPQEYRDDADYI